MSLCVCMYIYIGVYMYVCVVCIYKYRGGLATSSTVVECVADFARITWKNRARVNAG